MIDKITYSTKIEHLDTLSEQEIADLKTVTDKFSFRCNDYYLSLIDWDDPFDPIRRIVIPNMQELDEWGRLDPSDEKTYTVIPGLEHKYHSTALFLVSNVCDGICRYCFRKRVFMDSQSTRLRDIPEAIKYVRQHPEITNVLLTGGDPLVLKTSELDNIIRQLRTIDHVEIIRIGTKMPAFNPYRILDDPILPEMLESYSTGHKKIYIMTHFVHPRELTEPAVKTVHLLQKAGAMIANQTPLIRGLNDDPQVLAELLGKLSFIGAVPYYIFQCRPALGNKGYTVPIEEGYRIVERAKARVSGLAKRLRFVMSHSAGKIEIAAITKNRVYFKFHRAANDADSGRFLVLKSNPNAYWLDDYDEVIRDYAVNLPYRSYGPD
ncbi:MAG: KamA family radical SAM protein [Phycisphaerae bacterium]|nr:KamA family radical SAM protein [Phycisphaerae bacterium]NIP54161.1 KamA family radical SAM protein [Phycisphaerae bacterium]NIS53049.1 KamA family radical SAM protein [Phycisphaerae bacterium]NIU10538.1 KamA family radical SAM protein [Phycisphaerae bacterium]NIU57903.1 KamA family radical SAM protein [Phycisphaerae bacterium]